MLPQDVHVSKNFRKRGEADPILPSSWADRLEDYFSQLAGVQLLAGIGHFVPFEAPDAMVEAIRTVL